LELTHYSVGADQGGFSGGGFGGKRRRTQERKRDPVSEAFEDVSIESEYRRYSKATQQSLQVWNGEQIDLGLVEATLEHICVKEEEGAILVFLTGWDEISKLIERLKSNPVLNDSSRFLMLPLHGSMPTINQREIFQRPPRGVRKIVLATNIAETSITIDDVVYVIDCGKAKETSYDALNKLACLLPSWVSKASAHQVISIQIELLYLCSFVSCIGFCDCHNLAFSANLLLSTSHGLNHQVSLWLRNCSSFAAEARTSWASPGWRMLPSIPKAYLLLHATIPAPRDIANSLARALSANQELTTGQHSLLSL
jgi:hypothetical protein